MGDNNSLVIIAGPTAIGKTEISIELADRINGEIISADSMQVYRGMDIGTAKITKEEMRGIRHYLIDTHDPSYDFNVTKFQEEAKEAIANIYAKGKIPIIAGGTGFYIQSVLYDIDFDESETLDEYRDELWVIANTKGSEELHKMLEEVDETSAKEIHHNNIKRVIRALEYNKQTGLKFSAHNEEQRSKESKYNACYFVLNDDRDKIYNRINVRVDKMIDQGLVNEVQVLIDKGYNPKDNISMLGLGYKEIYDYLMGITSLSEAIELIKRDTRHFAKKQLTWFKREKNVIWIEKSTNEDMLSKMLIELENKNII